MASSSSKTQLFPASGFASFVAVYVLAVWFMFFMEWLFFVTKPSFLSAFSWPARLRVLAAATLPPVLAGAGLIALGRWVGHIFSPTTGRIAGLLVACCTTAVVLTSSALLLVDNFLSIVLGMGTAESGPKGRAAFACALGVCFVVILRWAYGTHQRLQRGYTVGVLAAAALIGFASVAGAVVDARTAHTAGASVTTAVRTPNVVFVGFDGVDAEHMSLYGYARKTTPFLDEFGTGAMVFTNAFSNAANTAGSLTALLTGQLPTRTHVIYSPDILRSEDANRHLPGILRAQGYRAAQFTIRHFAASIDFNLRDGFDITNGMPSAGSWLSRITNSLGTGGYFLDRIVDRLTLRIQRLTGQSTFSAYDELRNVNAAEWSDRNRLQGFMEFLQRANEPFFAHAHLMVTHGPYFAPAHRKFSVGKVQTQRFMREFADDAILDADAIVSDVVALLRRRHILDRTMIVIYSDHGSMWRAEVPIPLVIRLPGQSTGRRVTETVQLIDVAPTVLDELGLRAPVWMTGTSLLRDLPRCRAVFASVSGPVMPSGLYTRPVPPFFSLGSVSLVRGNQWFQLSTTGRQATKVGSITRFSRPDEGCGELTPNVAEKLIVDHLQVSGYELPSNYGIAANGEYKWPAPGRSSSSSKPFAGELR